MKPDRLSVRLNPTRAPLLLWIRLVSVCLAGSRPSARAATPVNLPAPLRPPLTVRAQQVLRRARLRARREAGRVQLPLVLALRRHGVRRRQQQHDAREDELGQVVRLVQADVDRCSVGGRGAGARGAETQE